MFEWFLTSLCQDGSSITSWAWLKDIRKLNINVGKRSMNQAVLATKSTQAAITCSKSTMETSKPYEICSKLTIKTPKRGQ